jgi:hypothetical protein
MQCTFTIPIYIIQRKEILGITFPFSKIHFATKVTVSVGKYFGRELFPLGTISPGKFFLRELFGR